MKRLPADRVLATITDVRKCPLVSVEWVDACSTHGWYTVAEARKEAETIKMRTVGFLVRRDREQVAVAQTISKHGRVSEVWSIPTPWVTKVRRLA